MKSIIGACGDNCSLCPRYTARTKEELNKVAELWYKVGWRKKVVSEDEINCNGCDVSNNCRYEVNKCVKEKNIRNCGQCKEYKCEKVKEMLKTTLDFEKECLEVCNNDEYEILKKAFFEKELNLSNNK